MSVAPPGGNGTMKLHRLRRPAPAPRGSPGEGSAAATAARRLNISSAVLRLGSILDQRQREREPRDERQPRPAAASVFCQSRQGRNSSASSRSPPARCAASSDHEHPFGELDQRLVGPAQERVQRASPCSAVAQRPEMQRQEQRERQAREPVHEEGPVADVVAARLMRTPPRPRAGPSRRARSRNRAARHSRDTAAPAEPFAEHGAQADRRVHRDREHEHASRRRTRPVAARAAEDLGARVSPPRTA